MGTECCYMKYKAIATSDSQPSGKIHERRKEVQYARMKT